MNFYLTIEHINILLCSQTRALFYVCSWMIQEASKIMVVMVPGQAWSPTFGEGLEYFCFLTVIHSKIFRSTKVYQALSRPVKVCKGSMAWHSWMR